MMRLGTDPLLSATQPCWQLLRLGSTGSLADHKAESEPDVFKVRQRLDSCRVRSLRGNGVLPVLVTAMVGAARHHLVGTMLDADRHTECSRVKAGRVSSAADSGAELGDVFEWHG